MPLTWPFAGRGRARRDVAREEKSYPGFVALHMQGEAAWTRRDYAGLARQGYMLNPVAHRCVRLISEAAGAAPLVAYQDGREVDAHPALDLVRRPNGRQSGPAFLESLVGHLLIAGNAYVELVEASAQARELHLLRPDRVAVLEDADGWPVALDYRAGKAKRRIALGEAALHLTLFHPLDDHYGFPPLEAALMSLDIHNAAGRWNKALLDNSARPSGALVYVPKEGGNLTDEQFDRLKVELEQGYQGASRAGRPMLLEGGLDWKAMGLSPKDMDFLEARNGAARDIALAFGVPPMLLGIPGDNTYANYQEANRAFHRLTVLPMLGKVAGEFSRFLSARFGDEIRIWYDPDGIEGLSVEREALWRRLGAADFITNAEKREAVGYGREEPVVGESVVGRGSSVGKVPRSDR